MKRNQLLISIISVCFFFLAMEVTTVFAEGIPWYVHKKMLTNRNGDYCYCYSISPEAHLFHPYTTSQRVGSWGSRDWAIELRDRMTAGDPKVCDGCSGMAGNISQPENQDGICRDLQEGDKHYSDWTRCCDIGGGKSRWWKRSTGKAEDYNGTCKSLGINEIHKPDDGYAIKGYAHGKTANSGKDYVGRGTSYRNNGIEDAVFRASINAPGQVITGIKVENTNGKRAVWDTYTNNRFWLGVAAINGRAISRSDGTVNYRLGRDQAQLDYYCEDNGSVRGRQTDYNMSIYFASGDKLVLSFSANTGAREGSSHHQRRDGSIPDHILEGEVHADLNSQKEIVRPDFVVWLHSKERACCAGDWNGVAPYVYHGSSTGQVRQGAIVLKRFRSEESAKRWLCNRKVHRSNYQGRTWAEIDGYIVKDVPCSP